MGKPRRVHLCPLSGGPRRKGGISRCMIGFSARSCFWQSPGCDGQGNPLYIYTQMHTHTPPDNDKKSTYFLRGSHFLICLDPLSPSQFPKPQFLSYNLCSLFAPESDSFGTPLGCLWCPWQVWFVAQIAPKFNTNLTQTTFLV